MLSMGLIPSAKDVPDASSDMLVTAAWTDRCVLRTSFGDHSTLLSIVYVTSLFVQR